MICCEILRINGIVTHEIGCPNQGQVITRHKYPKFYVGILKGSDRRKVFTTALEPCSYYFPEFGAIVGPFRTKRGAKWCATNPYSGLLVSEMEIKAKEKSRREI